MMSNELLPCPFCGGTGIKPVTEEIANDPWTAMQVASLKSYLAEEARISAVERALLATVEGDGNEYMVRWTYGGEAFLIMTRKGDFQ